MLYRQERFILAILLWVAAGASAPYATYMFVRYGLIAALWSILLSLLLFVAALLCTHINDRLNATMDEEDDSDTDTEAAGVSDAHEAGLRILRIAQQSPLRGHVNERAIIVSINGEMPSTAAEANGLMVEGTNHIEWMGPNGKVLTSTVECHGEDIMAQFEQITPPRRKT
ncbi:hypothetical protein [Aidingimonas lacisalsi]|uniref:hypothetical protein n=1 Tax=Aidingimonas lacisalsi TaxID=2604086 RepID=UPI0011D29606|nr:hypothetical protein [Aidingimonas lacisalsi]